MKTKRLLAMLLSLVLLFSCGAQLAFAEGSDYVCVKETSQSSDGSSFVEETTFDKQGNPVKIVSVAVDEDGGVGEETTIYAYDQNGNLTKETYTRKTSDGYEKHYTDSFVYDKNGNVVENTFVFEDTEGDNGTLTYRYTYDEQDRIVKEVCDSGDGEPEVWTTAFDAQGNVTEETYASTEGNWKRVSTYNSRGLVTKVVENSRSPESSWQSVDNYTYDPNGNLTKATGSYKGSDGYRYRSVEKTAYDNNGNVTRESATYIGPLGNLSREVSTYSYDAKGRLTNETYRCFDVFEVCKRKTAYTYNDQDQMTKVTERYFGTDGLIGKGVTTFTYNEDGDLTGTKETYRNATVTGNASSDYAYFGAGKLKKEETNIETQARFFFGGYQSRTAETSEYDIDGNLLRYALSVEDDSGLYKYADAYTYDVHGNMTEWISNVERGGDVLRTVSTFEYQKIGA